MEMTGVLERAAANNLLHYVQAFRLAAPQVHVAATACAGGVAAFTGVESPLTTVKGAGPEIGDGDLDTAEAFFAEHGSERVVFELAPWITSATEERLARRGFEVTAAENILVRQPPFDAPVPGWAVSELERALWADAMFEAFGFEDVPIWHHLVAASAALPEAVNLGIQDSGGWTACAQLAPAAGVAIFACDGTLARARGRGAQTALINDRLRRAAALRIPYAVAEVAPGGQSERNYLRSGFRLAYSRKHYSRRRIDAIIR